MAWRYSIYSGKQSTGEYKQTSFRTLKETSLYYTGSCYKTTKIKFKMVISNILWTWVVVWTVSVVVFIIKELYRNFILDTKIRKENTDEPIRNEKLKDSKKNINNLIGLDKKTFLALATNMIIISLAFLSFIGTSGQNKKSLEISDGILGVMRSTEKLDLEPIISFHSSLNESKGPYFSIVNTGGVDAIQAVVQLISHEYNDASKKADFKILSSEQMYLVGTLEPYKSKSFYVDDHFLRANSRLAKPEVNNILEARITYRRDSDRKFFIRRTFYFISGEGLWVPEGSSALTDPKDRKST